MFSPVGRGRKLDVTDRTCPGNPETADVNKFIANVGSAHQMETPAAKRASIRTPAPYR